MNPSGFYVDPRKIYHIHVTEHRIISVTRLRHMRAYAKKSLRNFFKSGGFNQKRQLPTLPL